MQNKSVQIIHDVVVLNVGDNHIVIEQWRHCSKLTHKMVLEFLWAQPRIPSHLVLDDSVEDQMSVAESASQRIWISRGLLMIHLRKYVFQFQMEQTGYFSVMGSMHGYSGGGKSITIYLYMVLAIGKMNKTLVTW